MKKLYFIFATTLIILLGNTFNAFAQAPEGFTYQAEARDGSGRLLTSKALTVETTILKGSSSGYIEWKKDYNVTTDNYGLFTIVVGELDGTAALTGNFSAIDWGNGTYFLNVKILWAKKWIDTGTTQLLSVPYALYAKSAGSANITETDPVFTVSQAANITGADIAKLNNLLGTNTGDQDISAMSHTNRVALDAVTGINTGDQDLSGLATTTAVNSKVDKVTGKGLSTNDYTTVEKTKLAAISGTNTGDQDISAMSHANRVALDAVTGINTGDQDLSGLATTTALNSKVDIISGKGLSTEDYTTANKTKLAGIAASAEVNVNADWSAVSGDAQILNKPSTIAGYGITDVMTTAHPANGIAGTNITNWNAAYGWGSHTGLYLPITYVPAWSEITSNPFSFSSVANNQLLKYNSTSGKWENWIPNYLTSITGTGPIVSSGGTTPVISITVATTSAAGSMSAADKTKLDAATNVNTPSTLVARDASGNFTAGNVTANLNGNATSATTSANITGGAVGSIPYQTAANATTLLAKGTAGQVLTMNSGATAPEWSSPTTSSVSYVSGTAPIISSGGNTPFISITAATEIAAGSMSAADKTKLEAATNVNKPGTIVARDASGNFTAGTVTANLIGNATTATTATTASNASNIAGGAVGSIPYQTDANATTLLAKGTARQVLTMNAAATAPQWTTPTTTIPVITKNQLASLERPGEGMIAFCTDCGSSGAQAIFANGTWKFLFITAYTPPTPEANPVLYLTGNALKWKWNSTPNADGYKFNTTNNYNTARDLGLENEFSEEGIVCNKSYERYVWAYNGAGPSAPLVLYEYVETPPAPEAKIASGGVGTITWRWTNVLTAAGYKWNTTINLSTATDIGNNNNYLETVACANITRYVWAYNSCGTSEPLTLSFSATQPAPTALTPVLLSNGLQWRWNAANGANGYKWNTSNNYAAATDLSTATTKDETRLTCGTTATRYVWAYNDCSVSAPLILTGTPTVPATPTAGAHTSTTTTIYFKWNAVEGATGYKWNYIDNLTNAVDVGTQTTMTLSSIQCNTTRSIYVWAYNDCGKSVPVILTYSTGICPEGGNVRQ